MLQLYPVYLLWNRHKTITGSPDPTRMQTMQINLAQVDLNKLITEIILFLQSVLITEF